MSDELIKMLKKIKKTSYKTFLALFIATGIICLLALRQNNQTMVNLRDKVYEADKNGSNVEVPLDNLRRYVYAHMNTDLSSGSNGIKPPIQLKYTYQRLVEKAQQDTSNSQLYIDAKNYCEAKIPASVSVSGRGRVQCIEDYVLSHGGVAQPANIPAGLYQFDFVSPSWSPDLAGISLVLTVIFFTAFVISFLVEKLVNTKIKPW